MMLWLFGNHILCTCCEDAHGLLAGARIAASGGRCARRLNA